MRLVLPILATLTFFGCSGDSAGPAAPTSLPPPAIPGPPSPPREPPAWVWTMVVADDGSGICILDATVEVVAGQGLGQSARQSEPCDVWWVGGIQFRNLTPGVAMTLRATAAGYLPEERTVLPTSGSQAALIFSLRRSPAP